MDPDTEGPLHIWIWFWNTRFTHLRPPGIATKKKLLALLPNLPGIADDERPEDRANTGSGAGHSHSGGSGSDELGGRVDVPVGSRGLESTGGHSLPLHPHDHSTAAGGQS